MASYIVGQGEADRALVDWFDPGRSGRRGEVSRVERDLVVYGRWCPPPSASGDGAAGTLGDPLGTHRRRKADGGVPVDAGLDGHPHGRRGIRRGLGARQVITGHESDRHAVLRGEHRVHPTLGGRRAVDPHRGDRVGGRCGPTPGCGRPRRRGGEDLHRPVLRHLPPPAASAQRITEGARSAVGRSHSLASADAPYTYEITFDATHLAALATYVPGVEPVGQRAVRFTLPTMYEAIRCFRAVTRVVGTGIEPVYG